MDKVEYTVRGHASWNIPMDLTTAAPDTSNPEVPSFGTVRPTALGLNIMPNVETGAWEVASVGATGPKVKDGKVVTKRDYAVQFMDPLEPGSVAPDWIREICQHWTDRANGISTNSLARVEQVDERSPFEVSERAGAVWAIEQVRDAQHAAEVAYRHTKQRDYRHIAATLRATADELVRTLNGVDGLAEQADEPAVVMTDDEIWQMHLNARQAEEGGS